MKSKDCLIVGYGVVGSNIDKELAPLKMEIYDKYKPNVTTKSKDRYDFGFICVDTPLSSPDGQVDVTEVRNAVIDNKCDIYIIKSTCHVGFIDELKAETGKHIVYSPEFYGGTQHCNNFEFAFTVIGGDVEDCVKVQQLFQLGYDARHRFYITDAKTASMVKFMDNSWLATKVTFCCDFYRACQKAGVNYEQLRELWVADPRVNPAHTFVYEDTPFFNSHCLNKDVPSIANQFDMDLLKAVVDINNTYKPDDLKNA